MKGSESEVLCTDSTALVVRHLFIVVQYLRNCDVECANSTTLYRNHYWNYQRQNALWESLCTGLI
jgi:hypothetical protein